MKVFLGMLIIVSCISAPLFWPSRPITLKAPDILPPIDSRSYVTYIGGSSGSVMRDNYFESGPVVKENPMLGGCKPKLNTIPETTCIYRDGWCTCSVEAQKESKSK